MSLKEDDIFFVFLLKWNHSRRFEGNGTPVDLNTISEDYKFQSKKKRVLGHTFRSPHIIQSQFPKIRVIAHCSQRRGNDCEHPAVLSVISSQPEFSPNLSARRHQCLSKNRSKNQDPSQPFVVRVGGPYFLGRRSANACASSDDRKADAPVRIAHASIWPWRRWLALPPPNRTTTPRSFTTIIFPRIDCELERLPRNKFILKSTINNNDL